MIEIYAKKQRAKRKDPQQEAIVAEKDVVNERTKKLIALMIAMKKGWNGGPSPDIGVEKFNLTQPIPDIVVGTGDAALHEMSDIVQTLRKIKSLQDTYAVTHGQRSEALQKLKEQKSQIQPDIPTPQPVPTTDTSQQITSAVAEELMKKTASNPLTRIWTHLTAYNPFASEKNRGYRLELLRSLARVDGGLEDIEDKILSQGESSVLDSVYIAKQLYSDAKSSFFGDFRRNISQMLSDAEDELKALKEGLKQNKVKPVIRSTAPAAGATNTTIDLGTVIDQAQSTISAESEADIPESFRTITDPAAATDSTIDLSALTEPPEPAHEPVPEPPGQSEADNERQKAERDAAKAQKAKERALKADEKSKARAERAKAKRKIPIAPVPQSDFIDSDFEKAQSEKYEKIKEYVFKHVDTLLHECLNIANSNLPRFWKLKVREEVQRLRNLAIEIVNELENNEDFDVDYPHFLEGVGIVRAMDYIARAEIGAAETNPEFVSGSLFNEAEIKSQAINFAREQMGIFIAMSKKVSQASVASRFIKRMITHIIPRRDRSLRLTISRNIRRARKGLQNLLDILEQRNVDFRRLMNASQEFLESMSYVFEGLADLGDMYNSTMRMEKSIRKQHSVKMTYDMIPTMDINALRMAGKSIGTDLFNIQKIDILEDVLANPNKVTDG